MLSKSYCLLVSQYSFAEHSEQQAALAQHLVGKVKQLQEANINIGGTSSSELNEQENESIDNYSNAKQEDTLAAVQDLTSQLLNMVRTPQLSSSFYMLNLLLLLKINSVSIWKY